MKIDEQIAVDEKTLSKITADIAKAKPELAKQSDDELETYLTEIRLWKDNRLKEILEIYEQKKDEINARFEKVYEEVVSLQLARFRRDRMIETIQLSKESIGNDAG